jgi:hypothetical protein
MSIDRDALLALHDAWNGALAAADRLRALEPGSTDPGASVDLVALHNAAFAHANAAMALRGLIEELQRKAAGASTSPPT